MRGPTSVSWRLVRAGVFAVVATQLAVLGHALGGGHLPDLAVLVTVTVFLGGSLSGLARGRRTGPQIFLALIASQLAFHAAFSVTDHGDGSLDASRMLAFHLCAALAAAWVMSCGESTLFRLFAALHRVLAVPQPSAAVALPPGWTSLPPDGGGGLRFRAGELSPVSRRGPPVPA